MAAAAEGQDERDVQERERPTGGGDSGGGVVGIEQTPRSIGQKGRKIAALSPSPSLSLSLALPLSPRNHLTATLRLATSAAVTLASHRHHHQHCSGGGRCDLKVGQVPIAES